MKRLLLLLLNFTPVLLAAQSISSQPAQYRSDQNPYYWKNRPPYAGYWQQDVRYKLDATLIDTSWMIEAKEELTYFNNSPDTLKEVFFHLYQNAFQPDAYYDKLYEANHLARVYGRYESQKMGTLIKDLKVEMMGKSATGSVVPKYDIDNTIMRVQLPKPLAPGDSVRFSMDFRTFFDVGSVRRRMKVFFHDKVMHFDAVHWYPRIAVYDRRLGWQTDQHLGREFYGDFGEYEVNLTLPAHYIMEGTGVLQNRDEVLPKDLRAKLDMANFKDKPVGEAPSVIIPPSRNTKTWRWKAVNVHDFGWTADPTYRIDEVVWNGISAIAVAQENNAGKWQDAAELTAEVIRIYSRNFGMYGWPKIVVADARDGMEYNMMTLLNGLSPHYRYVLTHEVGHEWFYGMVGSNETYRAFMDEGFTQFLTAWSLENIGLPPGQPAVAGENWRRFRDSSARYNRVFNPYLSIAADHEHLPLNTHSDHFHSAIRHGGGYGQVYYKPATMLYNLQYLLGDSVFQVAMKHYFNQWKFCHPYPEDFTASVQQIAQIDLSQFFDAWLTTNKYIDYSITKVKKAGEGQYDITFKRKGSLDMPLDFTVITKDGQKKSFTIPNGWYEKPEADEVLPRWIGWDKLNPTYTARVNVPGKIDNVIIDTTDRLADAFKYDNQYRQRTSLVFDNYKDGKNDNRKYMLRWRPALWYNQFDGLKPGLHLEGDFAGRKRFFNGTVWYNTTVLQQVEDFEPFPINFAISFRNPIDKVSPGLEYYIDGRLLEGLDYLKLGFSKRIGEHNEFDFNWKNLYRSDNESLRYLIFPTQWLPDRLNSTLNASFTHNYYRERGEGSLMASLRGTAPGTDYGYAGISGEWLHTQYLRSWPFRTRLYAANLSGPSIPLESKVFLGGANPEQMMENALTRTNMIYPDDWVGLNSVPNHFQAAGGLNVRGYTGYLVPLRKNEQDSTVFAFSGTSGLSFNAELDLTIRKLRLRKLENWLRLTPYLFFDAGTVGYMGAEEVYTFITPRLDAGAGFALTISKWRKLNRIKPFTIRFDMPLYLSHAPAVEGENFRFRWQLGIGRAF